VTGITLSQEQYKRAQNRAIERGLSRDTAFHLIDYRDADGRFDRIVSVGMFEHVGVGFYDVFFRKCAQLLTDDGVALLHTIGRSGPPGITNPWIAKYIFPGGYIPALSEVLPAVQRAGLLVSDVEILQLHYAETLKAWRERFLAHRDEVMRLYDQRFVRMWEFYLACSEMAFRGSDMVVFQIQLAKHKGVTPATRDYIAREEARLRARERILPGIIGYDQSVLPEIENGVLAGHHMIFLGERGQAKSRLIRLLECEPERHLAGLIEKTCREVSAAAGEADVMHLLRRMKSEAALLIALADIGEHVEAGHDPDEDDRPEVEDGVAVEEQENQVFAGVVGAAPLIWRISMSCEIRSSGTGKTTTVFRSTPISVRVCK